MNKAKAERKIRRKVAKAVHCPFCGNIPTFDIKTDPQMSERGSIGHYAVRRPCCKPTGTGQAELFFTNDFKPADYGLWWKMACSLVDDWNRRHEPQTP